MAFEQLTREDRAFTAHVEDLFQRAQQKYTTCFTNFLDLHQIQLAQWVANASGYQSYAFYAGHPEGERRMLGVFAPYEPVEEAQFPIAPLTITFRKEDQVGHRDLLGSLLGLQLKREAIGDILLSEGLAVCFVTQAAAPLVLGELKKVGRVGVKVMDGAPRQLPELHHFKDLPVNVSSLRLDCVVAAVCGISREKAVAAIRAGLAAVNGAPREEISSPLEEGDVLSIRGTGKFRVEKVLATTKKGRLQLLCKKYV